MIGDDLNPTVTSVQVGFGTVSDERKRGSKRGDEGKGRNGNDERMQVL